MAPGAFASNRVFALPGEEMAAEVVEASVRAGGVGAPYVAGHRSLRTVTSGRQLKRTAGLTSPTPRLM